MNIPRILAILFILVSFTACATKTLEERHIEWLTCLHKNSVKDC